MNICASMLFVQLGDSRVRHNVSLELFFNGLDFSCIETQVNHSNQSELKSSSSFSDYDEAVNYLESRSLGFFDQGMCLQSQVNCDFSSKVIREFKPAEHRLLVSERLHNQFLSEHNWVGYGVRGGNRIYIEFSYGEVHKVIDSNGNPFIISAKIKSALGSPFQFTRSVILEAYALPDSLLMTDFAALNYTYCDSSPDIRNQMLHEHIEPNHLVEVCKLVEIDINLLHEPHNHDETAARYFVAVDERLGFRRPDELSNLRFVIPRFYSIKMTVLAELTNSEGYAVGYYGSKELLAVSHVETKKLLVKGQEVVVNFTELDDGEFKGAWLGDDDRYCNHGLRQQTQTDLLNLSGCWAARLDTNQAERKEYWKSRNKSF